MTNILKKIPGFRSGKKLHAVIAVIFYSFVGLFLIAFFTPSAPTLNLTTPQIETTQKSATIEGVTYSRNTLILLKDNKKIMEITPDTGGKFSLNVNDLLLGENLYTLRICNDNEGKYCTEKEIKVIYSEPIAEVLSTSTETTQPVPTKQTVKVTRIIDGDTIEIEGGQRIRYIGIDTPEIKDPNESVQCYGKEAGEKNKELVENKDIQIEKDISDSDQYDRLLRYVWVGDTFVNEYLVRQGYAKASSYPPDIKYQNQFSQAEKEARDNKRGLWGNICGCEKDKETSRTCTSCNKNTVTKTNWDCSTYTQEIDDTSCTTSCQAEQPVTPQPKPTPSPEPEPAPTPNPTPEPEPEPTPPPPPPAYTCNCSKTCPQILTCEEAYFQLNTCGCTIRDGDHDGIPCEALCDPDHNDENTPPPSPPPSNTTCNCSSNIYNCSDFSTHAEAQAMYDCCMAKVGKDIHGLDGNDNDGFACESLP